MRDKHGGAEHRRIMRDGYDTWTIVDIARRLAKGEKTILKGWCRLGQGAGTHSPLLRIVVMRLPTNELLALACSGNPRKALTGYRRRWTIETLFANLKTKGFNLEDTHIVDSSPSSRPSRIISSTGNGVRRLLLACRKHDSRTGHGVGKAS